MRALLTPRMRLVPVTLGNAKALWSLMQQPDLRRYQDLPNVGAAAFVEMVSRRPSRLHTQAVGRFEWMLYREPTANSVGWVSLRISERDPNTGEIGYTLLREYRGRGLASEAVRSVIGEAFETVRLRRVQAYCVRGNEPSRRLLERLEFVCDGSLPNGATLHGRPIDIVSYVRLRETAAQSGKTIEIPASV